MIRPLICLAILSAGVSTAAAQMGAPQGAAIDLDSVTGETLIYQFPEKWRPYSNETETKRVTMLFPTGQTPKKWKQALNVTEYLTTAGVTNASQVKDLRVKANKDKCAQHNVIEGSGARGAGGRQGERPVGAGGPPPGDRPAGGGGRGGAGQNASDTENGYSTSIWTEECDKVLILNKVILGNEKLYTLNLTFKSEPRASVLREFTDYMRDVFVCDPGTGVNPCAAPGGQGGGMGGGR